MINATVRRTGAALCDGLILYLVFFTALFLEIRSPWPAALDSTKAGFVLAFSMMTVSEMLYRATPGQMLWRLRLIDRAGGECSRAKIACRAFLFWMLVGNGAILIPNVFTDSLPLEWEAVFSLTIIILAAITPLVTIVANRGHIGIHDYLAGVVMVPKGEPVRTARSWGLSVAILLMSAMLLAFVMAKAIEVVGFKGIMAKLVVRVPVVEEGNWPWIWPTMSAFPNDRANDNRYYIDDFVWLEGDGSDVILFVSHERMITRASQLRELRLALANYVPRVDWEETEKWLGVNMVTWKTFGFGVRFAMARYVVDLESGEISPWPKVAEPAVNEAGSEGRVPLSWDRPLYYWMILPIPLLTQWGYPSLEALNFVSGF